MVLEKTYCFGPSLTCGLHQRHSNDGARMFQKVIIGLSINGNDKKSRSKAFKIAVSQPGVNSAAMKWGENNQSEVEGDQIDAVVLTKLLRKKLKKEAVIEFWPG
ncbi:hypothetical protein P3S67_007891 [Capsicum chacoense]